MGFTMNLICEDGDYIAFGKEIEVYVNHNEALAMLMFLIDKLSYGRQVTLRRFGIHDSDHCLMKKDVSKEFLEYANKEITRP